jgi:uncharacterized protein (TIGR02466 family)
VNAQAGGTPPIPNASYGYLFRTPFLAHIWHENAALNTVISERIFAHRRKAASESRSNVGGWHSETGELEFLEDARAPLMAQMHQLADEATRRVLAEEGAPAVAVQWRFFGWANISNTGDSHGAHTHPGSTWSGVYYVDTGESASGESGRLQFVDPSQGRANTFLSYLLPSSVEIAPQASLMVLFPSYLVHAVLPHRGARSRLSIAFNLRREPYP